MKPTRIIRHTTLALGLTAALAGISFATEEKERGERDESVPWSEVPAVVQAAIISEAKGGKVESVEKEIEGNGTTYEAKVKLPGGSELEIKTDAAGKVLGVDREDEKPEGAEDSRGHEN